MGSDKSIELLDKKTAIIDVLALIALAITLILGSFSFHYKSKLNTLLKQQREADQLNIAKSNEKSEQAKKDAALANANAAASDERSALAKKEAALANANAATSSAKAEEAKKEAALANSRIASANERSELAKKDAAQSLEKAALADLKSKELEIQLAKLKIEVAPRFIPEFLKENLKKELKKYSKKSILIICSINNDSEPISFCKELTSFFKSIGWESDLKISGNTISPAPIGFTIIGNGETNFAISNYIYTQFQEISYKCNIAKAPKSEIDILINVFAKQ